MTLGHHLKPKVDADGRVRFVRDRMAAGLILLILAAAFSYPLCCLLSDYGPEILTRFSSGYDVLPWLFVLGSAGFAVASLQMLVWRQVLICDPAAKTVTIMHRGLLRTRRQDVRYGEVTAEVTPVHICNPHGVDVRGYGLFVLVLGDSVLLSRAQDRAEVEQVAKLFSQLTSLAWHGREDLVRSVSMLDL